MTPRIEHESTTSAGMTTASVKLSYRSGTPEQQILDALLSAAQDALAHAETGDGYVLMALPQLHVPITTRSTP